MPEDRIVQVTSALTAKWYSVVYKHYVDGFLVDGDRRVVKTSRLTGQQFVAQRLTRVTPPFPVPARPLAFPYGEPVLVNTQDPFYIWTKKPDMYYPCWFVRDNGMLSIRDMETLEEIGTGTPPPQVAVSWSGGHEGSDVWHSWRESATNFFNGLGCEVREYAIPTKTWVLSVLEDGDYYYAIAHGGSSLCVINEDEVLYSEDIRDTLQFRAPYAFTFLGHCGAMDSTGPGTWSYEFTKGYQGGAVIGYTGMGTNLDAWANSLDWQKALFGYLLAAESVGEAYDDSLSDYPELIPATVAEGDLSIALAGGGPPDWTAMVLPLLGIGMFGSVGAQLLRGER